MRSPFTDSGHLSTELRAYYKSAMWKAIAKRIRKRDHYRCVACGINPYADPKRWWQFWRRKNWLTVHHISYEAWQRQPGSEPDSDLMSLDRFCHEEVTGRFRAGNFGNDPEPLRRVTEYVVATKRAKAERRDAKLRRQTA